MPTPRRSSTSTSTRTCRFRSASRGGTIPSRRTSPSSKAATSSARSASCRTRAAHERMRPKRDILDEVIQAAGEGHREIQLLGQIVNHYQAPDDPSCDFAALLEAVHDVPGVERIRFASPHPRHVPMRLDRGRARSAEGLQAFPSARAVGLDARARGHAPPVHARELSRAGRDAARDGAGHRADDRHDRGVSRERPTPISTRR